MDAQQPKQQLVLIVDDEALLRINAADFLQDAGYATLEADCGEDALAMVEANPAISIVFTDVNMPGEFDGLELATRIGHRWPEVQLIVASGKTLPTGSRLPPNGLFISKPYTACAITRLMVPKS